MTLLESSFILVVVPNGVYAGQTINVSVGGGPSTQHTQHQPQVMYQQPPQAVMGTPTTIIVKENNQNRNNDDCLACLAGACLCCCCMQLLPFGY